MTLTTKIIPARQGYRIVKSGTAIYYGNNKPQTIVLRYPNTRHNFFYASAINSQGIQGQSQLTFDNREDAQRYLNYLIQADVLNRPNEWRVGTTNQEYECFKLKFRPFLGSADEFEGWLSMQELWNIDADRLEGNIVPAGNQRFKFNEFYKVVDLRPQQIDKLRYKIIQKIGTGHQPVIYRNGVFEIHNVQESEKGRILNILRGCDFISQTNVGSERYDFGHFDFSSGIPQPKKLFNIRGMIKVDDEITDESLNEAFEASKAIAWIAGQRRENVARMSAQNVIMYSNYIRHRCQSNYNSRENVQALIDIKSRCLLPLANRAQNLLDDNAIRCTVDNLNYVRDMINNLESPAKNNRFKFNENNSSKIYYLPDNANVNSAIDFFKKDGYKPTVVSLRKLAKYNNLLDDEDLGSYHQKEWDNKSPRSFRIDDNKANQWRASEIPMALQKKDGSIQLIDGRHRCRALINDRYDGIELLLKVEESLKENVEIHTELNPKLWDENKKLRPEVEQKIEEIVEKFVEVLKEDEIEIKVEDIYVLGSNANYNYNDDSDLDVHIIADEKSLNCDKDHLPIIYQAYKTLFNNKYDITFRGINVEIYVENKDELSNVATGVYSLNDGWIKDPTKYQMSKINNESMNKKVTVWMNKFEQIKSNPTVSDIEKYVDDIYDIRIKSLADEGEFGEDNLVFKEVRRNGVLDELKELKTKLESKELSLESLDEKFDINILKDSKLGFGDIGFGDTFKAPENSAYLNPGYLFTIVETRDGEAVTLEYDDPDFPGRFSGNLDSDVGYRFNTLNDLLLDLAKDGITINDFTYEVFDESLKEAKFEKQYEYDGPAFDYHDRDLGWFKELVSARSEKEALNIISFIIKRKLKMDAKHTVIYLEPSCLKEVEIQRMIKNDIDHFICPNCGSSKNDQGECPLCDLGDESILDESLEPVLYHGTNIKNGIEILYEDELKLGKTYSSGVRQISFTRDLNAILKNYKFQIIFEVDRDKLHSNYKITPISDNKNCAGVKVPVYSRYTNGYQKAEEVVDINITPFKKYINKVLVKADIYDKFMEYNDKYNLIDNNKIEKM